MATKKKTSEALTFVDPFAVAAAPVAKSKSTMEQVAAPKQDQEVIDDFVSKYNELANLEAQVEALKASLLVSAKKIFAERVKGGQEANFYYGNQDTSIAFVCSNTTGKLDENIVANLAQKVGDTSKLVNKVDEYSFNNDILLEYRQEIAQALQGVLPQEKMAKLLVRKTSYKAVAGFVNELAGAAKDSNELLELVEEMKVVFQVKQDTRS
jgi:hypothetical protein